MAAIPSMPGMEMSVITTSGISSSGQRDQFLAVARFGDDLHVLDHRQQRLDA
jgi:hypothetical protein